MSTPVYAWSMKDGDFQSTRLQVHLLLTGCYFAIATEWPGEEPNWYTKVYSSAEAAQAEAVQHTNLLELNGDTMERGPFVLAIEAKDQDSRLAELVGVDQTSALLDYLFEEVMAKGFIGEVIP